MGRRAGRARSGGNGGSDVDYLERIITENSAALVIVDVLNAYLSSKVDGYRDQDVRGALMPLAGLAERTDATVLVVRHLTKSRATNALYAGGGSIGIIAAARSAILVAPDPDDESGERRVLAMTKSNLAEMPDALAYRLVGSEEHGCARVVWEGSTEHRAADLLQQPRPSSEEDESATGRATQFLMEMMEEGPAWVRDIQGEAGRAGVSWRSVERAKKALGVKAKKAIQDSDRPGAWYWSYGDGTQDRQGSQFDELAVLAALVESDDLGAPDPPLDLD